MIPSRIVFESLKDPSSRTLFSVLFFFFLFSFSGNGFYFGIGVGRYLIEHANIFMRVREICSRSGCDSLAIHGVYSFFMTVFVLSLGGDNDENDGMNEIAVF